MARADLQLAAGALEDVALLRDMRRETVDLKMKVGYPWTYPVVPDSVKGVRRQKYVHRPLTLRRDGQCFDVGQVSVGYVEVESPSRPVLFVGESKAEAENEDPQHFEQSTDMREVRQGVWRTPLPLALRYFRFGGTPPLKVGFVEEIADVVDQVGFSGGSARDRQMRDAALRTLRLCMREFLLDGVKRDRLPWAGDLSVSLLATAWSFRDAEIVRRTIRLLDTTDWQKDDVNGIVDYSLWLVICHDLFQRHFGDAAFLRESYPRIAGRLESFATRTNADGVLVSSGRTNSWIFIDWVKTDRSNVALNAIYYGALCSGAALADRMGQTKDAARWRARAAALRATVRAKAWDAEKGLFRFDVANPSNRRFVRNSNIYAVYFGLAEGDELKSIGRALAGSELPPVGTPYVSAYEAMALLKCGFRDEARKLVDRIWGGMLDLGATTFWEGFNPAHTQPQHLVFYNRPYGKSLCHAWSAAPVFLLPMLAGEQAPKVKRYAADWASLDARPVPQWWRDAKFGIFIHWGPYAVPAFGNVSKDGKFAWDCYSEWYQGFMLAGKKPYLEHHAKHYHNAPYANFAAQFTAQHFNADEWAQLFKNAGAKYVVLTSKHHDGYALWPSPESPYYNAVSLGSGRDLAGEYCKAMRAAGLKRGFYYSMLEYANPLYPGIRDGKPSPAALTPEEWNRRVNLPQLKELVEKYEADIIWPDGEWDYPSARHCSKEYLAWLFNESKVKDTVVVNDRWGKECRGKHGGHYTTEYVLEGGDKSGDNASHPWEECRGIGNSFGYSRFETTKDYMTRTRCVETLVSCVSRGGNLLLNVGPTPDGRIPVIMQDRLLAIGAWLKVNGEAIYATTLWPDADARARKSRLYFTKKDDSLYAITFNWPESPLKVAKVGKVDAVTLLGSDVKVTWRQVGDAVVIDPPALSPARLPCEHAWTFKIVRASAK